VHFHFPFAKKKEKKKRRRARRNKNIFFNPFLYSISHFFFEKNNLAKFWKFWELLHFLFTMVSIGKVPFSECKVPFRPHRCGLVFFMRKKKMDTGFKIFHIFTPKNDLFSNFGAP